MLSEKIKNITPSITLQIFTEAKKLKAEGVDIIDMSAGEPDFSTPAHIKYAAIEAVNSSKTKYTINQGIVELREAIAEKLKSENNIVYDKDEIIVSNGAKQAIYNAVFSIIDGGDEVIIPVPYYTSHPQIAALAGGVPVYVNTKEENEFKLSISDLEKAVTKKTKMIILCNPSNPTGAVYTKEELQKLADFITANNLFVISDEIYEKIIYDKFSFTSIASLNDAVKQRTVTVNGVSKSYAMTGWRIGFAAGPSEIIKAMNKLQSHSTNNASSISQYAAAAAYAGSQDELKKMQNVYQERRDFIYKEITSLNNITCTKPKGAFYIFPNISKYIGKSYKEYPIKNSFDLCMYLLKEAKTAVVPGESFGVNNYIRLSFAVSTDVIKEGIERIKSALYKLQ